jgi:hypothetical protein
LETNGAVPQAWYEEILPLVDLFLFDYKATDPALHKELTGSSNEQILQNLAFLYEQVKSIVLRCPLIPGVNDDTIHLDAIAELHKEYPRLAGIELMPYHNLGVAKSGHIGELAPLPTVDSGHHGEASNMADSSETGWLRGGAHFIIFTYHKEVAQWQMRRSFMGCWYHRSVMNWMNTNVPFFVILCGMDLMKARHLC